MEEDVITPQGGGGGVRPLSLRRAAFTTTKVPRFDGTNSWEQYRQIFEAIVRSNGWDNDTAALQLFSHLEGDTLNVAHLVPLSRQLSRSGLVHALTAHYGSPGQLADYRRQFKKKRNSREDPAIFATALETLAVKAFGDMGQTARLRLIRDRFIAGHSNCDLRRHLDSVPPETIDAAFGRATLTRQFAGLVSIVRIQCIRPMPIITLRRQGWRWSPDQDQARISWMICSGGY